MENIKFEVILLTLIILLSSCASTTMIESNIPDTSVYLDDAKVGNTPYAMKDTKIVGTRTSVRLEKEGYNTLNTVISRNEQADVGAIIGGVFLYIPYLWAMKYNPTHYYELTPLKEEPKINIVEDQFETLRNFKKLLDEGLISQEEYDIEKNKVLNNTK